VIRVILGSSILFELYAGITNKRIWPLVYDNPGHGVRHASYYWSEANIFKGERIQGIVGNANTLAAIAMVGLILFVVEHMIYGVPRIASVVSVALAASNIALTKSAGIGFALVAVLLAGIVSIAAEGKDRDTRHRYYRVTWTIAGIALFLCWFIAKRFSLLSAKAPT